MDEEVRNSEDALEDFHQTEPSTALTTLNTQDLNQESLALINQIIAESDIEKSKDLTHLFNINQNKKTMVRIDKLSGLQDHLVDQFAKRIAERPDEISNKELMDGIRIVQDIIERGQKQVEGVAQTPLIQFNQQNNSVSLGDGSPQLSKESRDRVKTAVLGLLSGLTKSPTIEKPTENLIEVVETSGVEGETDD